MEHEEQHAWLSIGQVFTANSQSSVELNVRDDGEEYVIVAGEADCEISIRLDAENAVKLIRLLQFKPEPFDVPTVGDRAE
jgi:hypothetical protein